MSNLREPLPVDAPKTDGGGLAFDKPILMGVFDNETQVEYMLSVQKNRFGGVGLVSIESARLWIGRNGFDVDLVQDDPGASERAGDFVRRKLMPQIMAALNSSE